MVRRRDPNSLVVREPDGTLACLPEWMVCPEAAAFEVRAATGGSNTSAVQRFTVTVWLSTAVDYDADDDGLIEIGTLPQLDAVRHDLDGDGTPAPGQGAAYRAAFADAVDRLGCAAVDGCTGYELAADLDFDTNGSGGPDAGDAYWNGGAGWEPIGSDPGGSPRRLTATGGPSPTCSSTATS